MSDYTNKQIEEKIVKVLEDHANSDDISKGLTSRSISNKTHLNYGLYLNSNGVGTAKEISSALQRLQKAGIVTKVGIGGGKNQQYTTSKNRQKQIENSKKKAKENQIKNAQKIINALNGKELNAENLANALNEVKNKI